jgi:glycosyltransferase involved in cell wall biosynthesis
LARSYAFARSLRPKAAAAEKYDYVIGVDPDGLILATDISNGAPVVYFSLELLLADDLQTDQERALKTRERALSREAAFVIIQDPARAALMAEDNGLPLDRFVYVPNSPLGNARRTPSRYWHTRLGLPADARVALHAGSLGAWTGIEDLVASVPAWPEPWVCIVHTRYDAGSSQYVERLRAHADRRRVHFSLKPVPRDDYDRLIDGADVGLAFYVPNDESAFTQRNLQTIGLSSGKLAYFVRAGVPVVVNNATSVGPLVAESGCGVAVGDARDVPGALVRIEADYERYVQASCSFFERELNFERAFDAVIARLQAVRVAA